jgi:hypothetical protein
MTDILRPRTIAIHRNAVQTGVGAAGYGGMRHTNETVLASDLPASIQNTRTGRSNKEQLPSGSPVSTWRIYYQCPVLVKEDDIIVDDLGRRFQVIAAYPHALGYSSACELLKN